MQRVPFLGKSTCFSNKSYQHLRAFSEQKILWPFAFGIPHAPLSLWSIVPSAFFVIGVSYKESSLLSHCCSMHMENESLMQAIVVRGSVCTVCSRNGTFVWEFTIAQCQATGKGSRLNHETEKHRYHFRFLRSDPLSSIIRDSWVLFLVIFFLELVFLVF